MAQETISPAEWRKLNGLPPPGADRAPAPARPAASAPRPRMNKTEAAYGQHLEFRRLAGEIVAYRFEPFALRLADRTLYRFDYLVVPPGDGRLQVHEVKGFWRDDARVKFKVAAELYPGLDFFWVRRKGRAWDLVPAR